jgi:hypothetical protein
MLYVYAATWPGATVKDLHGVDGAEVELLDIGELAVAVSRHESMPDRTSRNIVAHHLVSLSFAEAAGAVPFRFGHVFEDEAQLSQQLGPRGADLAARLRELQGCVEMTLRLHAHAASPSRQERPGTHYLLAKKAESAAEGRLKDELRGLVKDWRRSQTGSEVRLACLIPSANIAELRRRVHGLATATGPWPPSSFV